MLTHHLLLLASSEGEHHGIPGTFITWLFKRVSAAGRWFPGEEPWPQIWFEVLVICAIIIVLLSVRAVQGTAKLQKVPTGLQNFWEIVIEGLSGLVSGFLGAQTPKFLPFLGTLFLYIFCMNLIGILPLFRSPTMTLSTTLALGLTTFVMVQFYAIRANGIVGYLKHFMGDVMALAPLMFVVHIFGELAKPMSLSLRLFGNIFGEDNVIEQLMGMGSGHGAGWPIPLQFPMLCFAIFTSFLQAFIFTTLASIYIASMVVHEGHDEHGGPEAGHPPSPGAHAPELRGTGAHGSGGHH